MKDTVRIRRYTTPAMTPSEKARVEAFSDGVFAIAITLLILEIRLPHEDYSSAAAAHSQSRIAVAFVPRICGQLRHDPRHLDQSSRSVSLGSPR